MTFACNEKRVCSTRLTHKDRYNGPTGYGMITLEKTIMELVTQMLRNMQDADWLGAYIAQAAAERERMIQEMNGHQQRLRSIESELGDLNQEVVRSLRDESESSITILQGAIEHTSARLKTEKQWMDEQEKSLTAAQWKKERFLSTCTQSEALLKALRGKKTQALMDVLHGLIKRIDVQRTNDVNITYFFSSLDESKTHPGLPALTAPNP